MPCSPPSQHTGPLATTAVPGLGPTCGPTYLPEALTKRDSCRLGLQAGGGAPP